MRRWFETVETEKTNIVSSRIRLTRNWNQYSFPSKLSEIQSEEVLERLHEGLKEFGESEGIPCEYTRLSELSELDCRALRERRILNSSIIEKKTPVGMMISAEEDVCLVLNGTDHLRLQVLSTGLCLNELWQKADRLDDDINTRFPYAFDEKYGYLTSFPTNVGTGLRASVLIHLPTLSMGKKFNSLLADLARFGILVRGVYGEGRENYGALYEISNQKTLGQTEKEIVDLVSKAAMQLNDQENQVRTLSLKSHRPELEDQVYKSFGVLKYARRLSMKDAMTFLSQLMAGISDHLILLEVPCPVYRLMLGIQTANLQKQSDKPLDKSELDAARAAYLRAELPNMKA